MITTLGKCSFSLRKKKHQGEGGFAVCLRLQDRMKSRHEKGCMRMCVCVCVCVYGRLVLVLKKYSCNCSQKCFYDYVIMLSTNVIFLSTDEENSMKVWDKVTHNGQDRERDP